MRTEELFKNEKTWTGLYLLGLAALFAALCLLYSADIHIIVADYSFKALYADYLFSRLPFIGGPGFEMPIIIDSLSSRHLPLMYNEYVGTAFIMLSLPFAAAFKVLHLPYSMALYQTIIGLLTLACVFYAVSKILDRTTALLTVSFLAMNMTYIHTVREALIREEIFQVFGLWAGLACVCRSQTGRQRPWIWAALFIFGFTLWGKIMFLGYIFGAAFGALMLPARKGLQMFKTLFFPSVRSAAASAAAFMAGCGPMLYIYATQKVPILLILWQNFTTRDNAAEENISGRVWDNFAIHRNVLQRIHNVYDYCAGVLYRDPFATDVPLWSRYLFIAAIVWALGRIAFTKKDQHLRNFLIFVLSGYALLLCLSCFVLGMYESGHIMIMTPFVELLCAVALADACRLLIKRRGPRLLALAAAVAFWSGERLPKARVYLAAARDNTANIHHKSDLAPAAGFIEETGADAFLYPDYIGWGIKNLRRDLPVRIVTRDSAAAFLLAKRGKDWYLVLDMTTREEFLSEIKKADIGFELHKAFMFKEKYPEMALYVYKIPAATGTNPAAAEPIEP